MKLSTKHFGEIDIDEKKIINFIDGIPGFEEEKRFVIIDNPEDGVPFKWLQSLDETELAFVIINPFIFKQDYEFNIPDQTIEKLKIKEEKDVAVYSIVNIPEDITKMTANLLGPVIINIKEMLGKQIVLDDNRYKTKHFILEEAKAKGKEE
ncbi:flagellar assembly factor FliW [Proteiniborus ethanoligenes]|uniref:Flagellar assembly factor FliW n=1 Tax=Proteiniborus ethanoligenes TaxID=415015 RepID=A0A1H3S6W4_9FIRM|nr:flagellar assembly protein FliW [Proteiniborus ethanoligenes]SDZ32899.1 flagellar assembly factor FliW [Proteiniborus ethanoligenes]